MKPIFQQGLTRAVGAGLFVVEPARDEIQVDLDGIRAVKCFTHQLYILEQGKLTAGWRFRITASRRKNHVHVTVKLPKPLPLYIRILLAVLLGDDRKRAAFNYVRTMNGNKYPVAFFEKARPKKLGEGTCNKALRILSARSASAPR